MSNNSRVGGILTIVSGSIGILGVLLILLMILVTNLPYENSYYYWDSMSYDEYKSYMTAVYVVMIVFGIIFSTVAITGGIFALRKKVWGLALAGSIVSILTFFPCGIPAVIFTAMGKSEFDHKELPAPTAVNGLKAP